LPTGLGLFARLAPVGFGATTVAAWFFAIFTGSLSAGAVGTLWAAPVTHCSCRFNGHRLGRGGHIVRARQCDTTNRSGTRRRNHALGAIQPEQHEISPRALMFLCTTAAIAAPHPVLRAE